MAELGRTGQEKKTRRSEKAEQEKAKEDKRKTKAPIRRTGGRGRGKEGIPRGQ